MADRNERIKIFRNTISLCNENENLKKAVETSILGQKIYWEEIELSPNKEKRFKHTDLVLSNSRTMEAARRYKTKGKEKVCVLNFASSVTPGGGVLRGTTAQEESICRISTLYPALIDENTAGKFYKKHLKMIKNLEMGRENRDDCIFTSDVIVIREDTFDCTLLDEKDWYSVDVITCAAPDLRYSEDEKSFHPTRMELLAIHEKRWRHIFNVALLNNVDILILGAFGCGAFYNPPELVAEAVNRICKEFDGCFERIEFAVYTTNIKGENYSAFLKIEGIQEMHMVLTEKQNSKITMPVEWENISPDRITKTINYLQRYCGHTERDRKTRWEFLVKRSIESFGGGCGGICGYKEYKRILKYIAPCCQGIRYGYVASAVCFIRMYSVDHTLEGLNVDEIMGIIINYQKYWYNHETIADGEYMWRVSGSYRALLDIMKEAYYQTNAAPQVCTILQVMYAMQWDEKRMNLIQTYLEKDDL